MQKINPINDAEVIRQKRNRTDAQKKNLDATKEGVVVNSLIKEQCDPCVNMNDVYTSMVISDDAKMPQKIYENKTSKESSILPISIVATGVMASLALLTALVKKSTNINLELQVKKLAGKKAENLTRNISITNEFVQSLYQIVQAPNQKTILAGTGVIVLGSMGFMGKMFMDGFKDVWVKKREADIQKNLQENLIAVETQSFSGKIQIIRSMLADKAREFGEYITAKPETPPAFKKLMSSDRTKFTGNEKNDKDKNLKYFVLGLLTLGAIVGLGFLAMKNLGKSRKFLEERMYLTKKELSEIISQSNTTTKGQDKEKIKELMHDIDADENFIQTELDKLPWDDLTEKKGFIKDIVFNTTKSTTKANPAIGGSGAPKPAFNSYVNGDYRSFFYNYLLDQDNPQFKMLFWGVTGLSAFSYGGKVLGEAVKDIQVKKMNAQTELELQQRLVSTELRNFKAKKDSAISPLTDEFYTQIQRGKPKEELKTMAENILSEVKNGPPFVYS